jgi:hypothetical protein
VIHKKGEGMGSITITITEIDNKLSVSCNIPDELKEKVSGALAARTLDYINITMNKLTREDKKFTNKELN